MWESVQNQKLGWLQLKECLLSRFEDPAIKAEWKTNLRAHIWDEDMVPLQTYYTEIRRYTAKYDSGGDGNLEDQCYTRFVCGLPPDYQEQVKMSIDLDNPNVEKALSICTRFQLIKKARSKAAT